MKRIAAWCSWILRCRRALCVSVVLCLGVASSFAAIKGSAVNGTLVDSIDDESVEEQVKLTPIIVRVTGYGAFVENKKGKDGGKRLRAIRASKLDAYRNLAERVYGLSVVGSSSVKDFMLQQDELGTAVETVIRGARVVSITENKDTGIETVLELVLPGNFQDCLNKVNNFKYDASCLRPMSSLSASSSLDGRASRTLSKGQSARRMEQIYYLK